MVPETSASDISYMNKTSDQELIHVFRLLGRSVQLFLVQYLDCTCINYRLKNLKYLCLWNSSVYIIPYNRMLYRILLRTFYFVYQKALQSFRLSPATDPLRNFDFHISDKYTVAYPYPHNLLFLSSAYHIRVLFASKYRETVCCAADAKKTEALFCVLSDFLTISGPQH